MGTDMEKGMGRGMTREAAETLLWEFTRINQDWSEFIRVGQSLSE